jgi:hypothetical protein
MDFDMNTILDTVLDDIDHMLLTEIILPDTSPSMGTSPTGSCSAVSAVNSSFTSSHSLHSLAFDHDTCNDTKSSMFEPELYDAKLQFHDFVTMLVEKGSSATITRFKHEHDSRLQLKNYVFISKDCTYRLGQYIVKENWGKQCSLLYKYLDYIFRCQSFGKQMIEVRHSTDKRHEFLIFNTGLQRRSDNHALYALLTPNNIPKIQKWRVPFGDIKSSFLSKTELIAKLAKYDIAIDADYLPKRTKFSPCLADLLYDDTYSVAANWEERITTNKDRIYKVMGGVAFFDDKRKFMKLTELIEAFNCALPKSQRIAELNPRLAVAQGFVDTKYSKYRMELLLPLIVKFPRYRGKYYKFALAMGKSRDCKKYIVKSILTMDMAYANARLVGYVDSVWLCAGNKKKNTCDINDFCLNPPI